MNQFNKLFPNKPVIGMIHLPGDDPVSRAVDELALYEEEGVDGAIIENYHGSYNDVVSTLDKISSVNSKVKIGINILPNEFHVSMQLAYDYGQHFVQLDYIAGTYVGRNEDTSLHTRYYESCRERFPDVVVLGGVWPKYYTPLKGSNLEDDLHTGMTRAESIVVTGQGTGKETPLDKVKRFKDILGDHPLIIGAGLTPDTVHEQLSIADGCIVGSYFKHDNDTRNQISRERVKEFMDAVKEVRLGY